LIPAGGTFHSAFADPTPQRGWSYFIVAPATSGGVALLGDAGKFVSTGHKRITDISESNGGLLVSVAFAPNEGPVELHGFSQSPPFGAAISGSCSRVRFDPATHEFHVTVAHPDGETIAAISLSTNALN